MRPHEQNTEGNSKSLDLLISLLTAAPFVATIHHWKHIQLTHAVTWFCCAGGPIVWCRRLGPVGPLLIPLCWPRQKTAFSKNQFFWSKQMKWRHLLDTSASNTVVLLSNLLNFTVTISCFLLQLFLSTKPLCVAVCNCNFSDTVVWKVYCIKSNK